MSKIILFLFQLNLICGFQIYPQLSKVFVKKDERFSFRTFMVFDFIRKRTQEGISQVQNIATKSLEGKLGEALEEVGDYVKQRQQIDKENFSKMTAGLARSRDLLLMDIGLIFKDGNVNDLNQNLEKLEEILLRADIGSTTTTQILDDLRQALRFSEKELTQEDIVSVLRARLIEALTPPPPNGKLSSTTDEMDPVESAAAKKDPKVILVIGANGMGKTTTIGKLAHRLKSDFNATVLLGACDTFRAAAVQQLVEWSIRANVSIEVPLAEEEGGEPVPVAVRTVRRGVQEGYDVIILDTSGRLSNNFALTLQLQEVRDAVRAELPGAPHETLLVVDGAVGRNAVLQADIWRKKVGVDGLVVTKMDGTARGGFVVSVTRDLGLPVKYVGVGEGIDDLRDFEPTIFVDALLGNDAKSAARLQSRADELLLVKSPLLDRALVSNTSSSTNSGSSVISKGSVSELTATERLRSSFGATMLAGEDQDGDGGPSSSSSSKSSSTKKGKAKSRPQQAVSKKKSKKL